MNRFSFEWFSNALVFNRYVFRMEHFKDLPWDKGDDYFLFYKTKELVDQYMLFLKRYIGFKYDNLFEIGVYGGGSIPFWNEILNPSRHVGIDLNEVIISPYLESYITDCRANGKSIEIISGVDQENKFQLSEICNSKFGNSPIDIVIDDASHLYEPSKASFEFLFPKLRTGGLYIIEDWAWGHWEDFFSKDHFWAYKVPPTKLIHELTELAGSNSGIINSIYTCQGFVVIERGEDSLLSDTFKIENFIKKRPNYRKPGFYNRIINKLKREFKY